MAKINDLDSYEGAPLVVKNCYKYYQKLPPGKLVQDPDLIDLKDLDKCAADNRLSFAGNILHAHLECERTILGLQCQHEVTYRHEDTDLTTYNVGGFPGRSEPKASNDYLLNIQACRYCRVYSLGRPKSSSYPAYYTEIFLIDSI